MWKRDHSTNRTVSVSFCEAGGEDMEIAIRRRRLQIRDLEERLE